MSPGWRSSRWTRSDARVPPIRAGAHAARVKARLPGDRSRFRRCPSGGRRHARGRYARAAPATTVAPAASAPLSTSVHSGRVELRRATRSPGPIPSARSPRAIVRASAPRSPKSLSSQAPARFQRSAAPVWRSAAASSICPTVANGWVRSTECASDRRDRADMPCRVAHARATHPRAPVGPEGGRLGPGRPPHSSAGRGERAPGAAASARRKGVTPGSSAARGHGSAHL